MQTFTNGSTTTGAVSHGGRKRAAAVLAAIAISSFALASCDTGTENSPAAGNGGGGGASSSPAAAGGEFKLEFPLGLDEYQVKIPPDNPLTAEKVALGRVLYFDARLSSDDTISCASCHDPHKGYSNGEKNAAGVGGRRGARASPTIINRIFSEAQFWDGRAASLEEQALGPIQAEVEMNMTLDALVKKLAAIPGYPELFEKAFGSPQITADRIAKAVASFERTILSGESPFDRYEKEGDDSALTDAQKRGLELFRGKAKCSVCHTGFNLTDEKYHNIGTTYDRKPPAKPDPGRFAVTHKEEDRGALKTPTLRDIALTAPYFSDGSAATLREVVEFYNRGGIKNPNLSKNITPLGLTDREMDDLVALMKAFTGGKRVVATPPPLPGK